METVEAIDTDVGAETIGDDELEALALAADPDAPLPDDAQPVSFGEPGAQLLPGWYMPTATAGVGTGSRRRRLIVLSIVLAFVAIDAAGLCSTYGYVGFG